MAETRTADMTAASAAPCPILLRPSGKDYLWGGEKLKSVYGKKKYPDLDALHPLAETWECSAHPDGPSWAENGPFAGRTLSEIIGNHPEYMGEKFAEASSFPILIKFIDAAEELSVQVHPSDRYARDVEHQARGKTEMWYVLYAEEGSRLVWGFEHEVDPELLKEHIASGRLRDDLHYADVHEGDVFLIESGTVHALGGGIIVAEIQESSNLTYRLYDYGRTGKDGKKRALHFEKACDVLSMKPVHGISRRGTLTHYYDGCSREMLCRCRYFEVEKIHVSREFHFTVGTGSFQVLLCIEGAGTLDTNGGSLKFEKGRCIFLPASLGRCHVTGMCEVLKVRC